MTTLLGDRQEEAIHYRLGVASRVLAAIVGGYALAAAVQVLLILVLPLQHEAPFSDKEHGAELLIPAIHAVILLWVFHARSATRAWAWLIGWTTTAYALCWLLLLQGGAM